MQMAVRRMEVWWCAGTGAGGSPASASSPRASGTPTGRSQDHCGSWCNSPKNEYQLQLLEAEQKRSVAMSKTLV